MDAKEAGDLGEASGAADGPSKGEVFSQEQTPHMIPLRMKMPMFGARSRLSLVLIMHSRADGCMTSQTSKSVAARCRTPSRSRSTAFSCRLRLLLALPLHVAERRRVQFADEPLDHELADFECHLRVHVPLRERPATNQVGAEWLFWQLENVELA